MITIYKTTLVISFFFLFFACENGGSHEVLLEDSSNPDKALLGIWFNESTVENTNLTSRLEYNFKPDHTFEVARKIIDQSSNRLLGYRFKATGNYTATNQRLNMFNIQQFNNNDVQGLYADSDELIPTTVANEVVTISFNSKKNILTFEYPPCGPLANCMRFQTFYRE